MFFFCLFLMTEIISEHQIHTRYNKEGKDGANGQNGKDGKDMLAVGDIEPTDADIYLWIDTGVS